MTIKNKIAKLFTNDEICIEFFEYGDIVWFLQQKFGVDSTKHFFDQHPEYQDKQTNFVAYTWEGMEAYEKESKSIRKELRSKYPIRYVILQDIPNFIEDILYQIKQFKYYLKYRFIRKHQYNRVETGLKPGYYDISETIIFALFHAIQTFVDKEHSGRESFSKRIEALKQEMSEEPDADYKAVIQKSIDSDLNILEIYDFWQANKDKDDIFELIHADEFHNKAKQIIDLSIKLWT